MRVVTSGRLSHVSLIDTIETVKNLLLTGYDHTLIG